MGTVISMSFHILNFFYLACQSDDHFRTIFYIESCIIEEHATGHNLRSLTFYMFKLQFTRDAGHIFVSVHLADEVKGGPDIMDEVMRQGLSSVQEMSDKTYNTLSGFRVVDRWKSWEHFKKLGSRNSMEGPEMIKLLITVEDTGVGIPLDAQSRIFTPFMQADSSTSRNYGGTGIGLSICKCLVDLMGGEIGFVSEPGVGSTFSFTGLFRKVEATTPDTKCQQYEPALSELRGLRALVIDERIIRAEVTRYHLLRLGISSDIAFSLKSACSYLSR
jgi:histidine kinase 2/3/4 (cytokinin receptor)